MGSIFPELQRKEAVLHDVLRGAGRLLVAFSGGGEERLRALGFRQVRLRHHGPLARVEVDPAELPGALDPEMARRIVEQIKALGFRWVSLDLEGYRTGSLNEVLPALHRWRS